jgi:hypothetical protein
VSNETISQIEPCVDTFKAAPDRPLMHINIDAGQRNESPGSSPSVWPRIRLDRGIRFDGVERMELLLHTKPVFGADLPMLLSACGAAPVASGAHSPIAHPLRPLARLTP